MRINNNLSALNAYRNLSMTDNQLNKSLERLSSGLRINRAADDAAGLAISEKMRGQIRGLNQAMRNAMDGISFKQTAEGALNETHAILQRMRELSIQASSDTLTSSDRIEIQREIEHLTGEINRISGSTEFNTRKLLDGTSAALTSTSDLNTKIFMRGGLRTIDQFGQKAVGGGNYKLDISAIAGKGEVQKTDIMKVKHEEDSSAAIASEFNTIAAQTAGSGATIADDFLTGSASEAFGYTLTYRENLFAAKEAVIGEIVGVAGNRGGAVITHNSTYTGSDEGNFTLEATAVNAAVAAEIVGVGYVLDTNISASTADVIITVDGTDYTADLSDWDGSLSAGDLIDRLSNARNSADEPLYYVARITTDGSALAITHETTGANTITVDYAGDDGIVESALAALTGIAVDSNDTGTGANVVWTKTGPDGTATPGIVLEDGQSTAAVDGFQFSVDYTSGTAVLGDTFTVSVTAGTVTGDVEGVAGNRGGAVITHNSIYTGSADGNFTLEATAVNAAVAAEINGAAYTLSTNVATATTADVIITVDGTDYTADLSDWDGSLSAGDLIDRLSNARNSAGDPLYYVARITTDGSALAITHETTGANTIKVDYSGDNESVKSALAALTGIAADSNDTGTDANVVWTKTGPDGTATPGIVLEDGQSTAAVDGFQLSVDYTSGLAAVGDTFTVSVTAGIAVADGWVLAGTTGFDGEYALDATITYLGTTASLGQISGASDSDVITVNTNNIQTISFSNISGGTFNLTYGTEELTGLAYNISVAELQTAFEGLTGLTSGNVLVKGPVGAWKVTFMGDLAGTDVAALVINDSGLEETGTIGSIAGLNSAIYDIDRFWDANGNLIVQDPKTINLVQGDGQKTSITIFGSDTIQDVQDKLNHAIHESLGQKSFNSDAESYVRYVTADGADEEGFFTVSGTFVIQSAVTGKDGEIRFSGDEGVINALSLTTLQNSQENQFNVTVTDAHDPTKVIAENTRIVGNLLVGVVHPNVDVKFNPMAGISVAMDGRTFDWQSSGLDSIFIHLSDNTMVFHIGANPLQDVGAAIGDMSAEALGVNNILVTNRESANRAISQLDYAIGRVSSERAKMGALQNRLEHTINNLGVAAENLSAAESRVRDLDFALEMVEFTRNQIMMQAGTSMLAQANMKPQSVLMLLQ